MTGNFRMRSYVNVFSHLLPFAPSSLAAPRSGKSTEPVPGAQLDQSPIDTRKSNRSARLSSRSLRPRGQQRVTEFGEGSRHCTKVGLIATGGAGRRLRVILAGLAYVCTISV